MLGINQISKEINKKSNLNSEATAKRVMKTFLEITKQRLNKGESINFKGYFTIKRGTAKPKGSKHCNKHEKSLTDFRRANKGKGIQAYFGSDKFKSLIRDSKVCKDCQKKRRELLKNTKLNKRISFKPSKMFWVTTKAGKRK
ncbi:HU family DNA-binding protein [endosymbiont GvMRE of Glomus versiforme]|uniref:HU family DNA-binding protein n=1 Tax=endosymbiont GvMRE of Glomus versiforme TaxID=2039283 RepID=UPI000EBCC3C2|nr:HU family DNA-binding protein [endosymbiont GvMRE of Glomus versiforme]RHZ37431.1 hypothetical protein GvMRE_I1g558 [endosymbiont GvMRE of Glomus versiforme]